MGDVGAWCLPGYGVPPALILSKDGKVINALFPAGNLLTGKDRGQG